MQKVLIIFWYTFLCTCIECLLCLTNAGAKKLFLKAMTKLIYQTLHIFQTRKKVRKLKHVKLSNNFEAVNSGEPMNPAPVLVNNEIIIRYNCIESDPLEMENGRLRMSS